MTPRLLQILNLFGLILVLTMNGLANGLPLNGKTTGELSAQYPNSFVPAGFTFSIWGVIYLFLIAFVIFQFSQQAKGTVKKIGWLFFVSCLANGSWIAAWHYEFIGLSLAIMLVIFLSLLLLYLRLNIAREKVSTAQKWFVQVPFSLYLGWITVATIANTTALLVYYGWNGWGLAEPTWAGIMIFVAGVVGAYVVSTKRDPVYGLVLLWAFFGIWQRHQPMEPFQLIGLVVGVVLVLGGGATLWRRT